MTRKQACEQWQISEKILLHKFMPNRNNYIPFAADQSRVQTVQLKLWSRLGEEMVAQDDDPNRALSEPVVDLLPQQIAED
jgi:hypothetical protein